MFHIKKKEDFMKHLNKLLTSVVTFTLIGCGGGGDGSTTTPRLHISPSSPSNISTVQKIDAQNAQGYELSFPYERGTTAKITFGCDGTFSMDISLSGVERNYMRGDDITIDNQYMTLVDPVSVGEAKIALDKDDNIVKGSSTVKELYTYTISEIKKVDNCQ